MPASGNEDDRRQRYILNVLLLCTLGLIFLAMVYVLIDTLSFGSGNKGSRLVPVLGALVIFSGLYLLTRLRFYRLAAYGFISLVLLFATYPLVVWGIGIPQGLLMYALGLVMASVLIGTSFAAYVLVAISIAMVVITQLQTSGVIVPNAYWTRDTGRIDDALVFIFTLAAITMVAWLSNREIEKSLRRARSSERALQQERDQLEHTVEQRTAELRQAQLEKMRELYHFAEFGRVNAELIHDLVNPLTAVSLSLEELSSTERSSLLRRAITGTKYIEGFIQAARKQLQLQDELRTFSPAEEAGQAIKFLRVRARQAGVRLSLSGEAAPFYGNPFKFHKCVVNLLSNAIDAYEQMPAGNRRVTVTVGTDHDGMRLVVQDWGIGIPAGDLEHVFEPFFSTKQPDRGNGIGLAIVKYIVEQDFGGRIRVTSNAQDGTRFEVIFPMPAMTP